MVLLRKIMFLGIPIIILWGFFFFIQRDISMNLSAQLIFSLLYVIAIVLAIAVIQKVLIKRVRVFKTPVQILLKTLFYGAGILIGYLPVLVGEILYKISSADITDKIIPGMVNAFTTLFTMPNRFEYEQFFSPQTVSVLTSVFVLLLLIAFVAAGLGYIDTRWIQYTTEVRLKESRLKILEMQMKPHFLFNSLNSIAALIKSSPDQAEDLLIRLAEFLRFNFNLAEKADVFLKDELAFTENYLRLNRARFGDRLSWKITMNEDCKKVKVPGMIIQPCAENALKHGWKRENDSSLFIEIECKNKEDNIFIKIVDNGCGIRNNLHRKTDFPPKGHALHNIKERLQLKYAQNNIIKIESNPDFGTVISIIIPENS